MEVIREERASAEAQAAEVIGKRIATRAANTERVVLAVPGGRSVGGVLGRLAHTDAPFDRIELFFVDERCVPLSSEDSNYSVIEHSFLRVLTDRDVGLDHRQVHPLDCDPTDPGGAAASYASELERFGGGLDIALLGAGEDGHVASLFPGRDELDSTDRPFLSVEDAPKPPPVRVGASADLLRTAGTTVLLFFGEGKREALERFLAPGGPESECPARVVRENEDLLVFTDIDVAG
jgi:6-phosphogluconolactonase